MIKNVSKKGIRNNIKDKIRIYNMRILGFELKNRMEPFNQF